MSRQYSGELRRELSWDEVGAMCRKIATWAQNNRLNLKVVAGVKRGGVIPGTIIAYLLGLPFVPVEDPVDLTLTYLPENVLLIDDVCDLGETLHRFQQPPLSKQFNTAVLVSKPWLSMGVLLKMAPTRADFSAEWMTEWTVFPWER